VASTPTSYKKILYYYSQLVKRKLDKLKLITKYTADTRAWKQGGDEEGKSDKRVAASIKARQRETLQCAQTYPAEKINRESRPQTVFNSISAI
jgi:hypothetical protein